MIVYRQEEMAYQCDFYLKDERLCSIWAEESDERDLFLRYAEPLFRHGCSKGYSLKYQKSIFKHSFLKMLEDLGKANAGGATKCLTSRDISAIVTTYLLVKKFSLTELSPAQGQMDVVIVKDKFQKKRRDAFVSRKKDVAKVIETNVRHPATVSEGEAQEHACQRLTTRTRKRSRKTRRF